VSAMVARREAPATAEEAAELVGAAGRAGDTMRWRGGATKLGWGPPSRPPAVEISTARLDEVVEHNRGDLTAVLQAGVPLQRAQEVFAEAGQMFALDPPLGGGAATIGGVVATADQGPLRHRYGAVRDLLLGMTVVLTDGTTARSGGVVIKNVAGYDLAKLFAGSFGTLGLIVQVVVRLHPRPPRPLTVVGRSDDPDALARAASDLAHRLFEIEALDVMWRGGSGELLALVGGGAPERQAEVARRCFGDAGLATDTTDELAAWDRQRRLQRSSDGAVVRVSGLPAELGRALTLARATGATVVGRAGLGVLFVNLPPAPLDDLVAGIEEIRSRLRPWPCALLDAPEEVRTKVDVWGERDPGLIEINRRVKERFDPSNLCNPGLELGAKGH
jgi:glycolate dehydrogenase FAD-binding subunit